MAEQNDETTTGADLGLEELTYDEESVVPEYRQQSHPLAYELVGLQRVVNAIRLYGVKHSRAHEQTTDLLNRIEPLLDAVKTVQLEVTDGALLFGETRVVEESDHGGIVDELFRDGIRVLSLRRGIRPEEFLELLSILGTNFHLPQHQEDTLQGLLWAADLPHVSYEAVQGIEEAVEDSADAGRGESVDFDTVCRVLTGDAPAGETFAPGSVDDDRANLFASLIPPGEESRFPTPPDLPGDLESGISFGPGLGDHVVQSHDDDDDDAVEGLKEMPDWVGELGGGALQGTPAAEADDTIPLTVDGGGGAEGGAEAEAGAGEGDDARNHVLAADGDHVEDVFDTAQETHESVWGETSSLNTIDFVEGRVDELDASPDELLQIWEEADAETMGGLLDRCSSVLLHTALFEEPGADLDEAAPLIERCMEEAAEEGLVARYRSTVEMLGGIVEAEAGLPGQGAAEALLASLMRLDLLLQFARSVDPEDAEAARSIERVVELGGQPVLTAIIDHIPEVEQEDFRRFLIQRVVTALQGDPRPLTEGLRRMDSERMRIRLEALARMDNFVARDQLTSLLEHPKAEVRKAAVELIPSAHLRGIFKRLAQRLADEPDEEVRLDIIRRMDSEKLPALGPLLRRMVTAESFHKRSPEEKRLALKTLGRCGGPEGERTLATLLDAKASLVHPRQMETRKMAAAVLGRYGGATANAALNRAARSWDPGLRRAATEALERKGGRR